MAVLLTFSFKSASLKGLLERIGGGRAGALDVESAIMFAEDAAVEVIGVQWGLAAIVGVLSWSGRCEDTSNRYE